MSTSSRHAIISYLYWRWIRGTGGDSRPSEKGDGGEAKTTSGRVEKEFFSRVRDRRQRRNRRVYGLDTRHGGSEERQGRERHMALAYTPQTHKYTHTLMRQLREARLHFDAVKNVRFTILTKVARLKAVNLRFEERGIIALWGARGEWGR